MLHVPKTAAIALVAALTFTPVLAKQVQFRNAGPALNLTLPDNWTSSAIKNGIEIASADNEVLIWIQGIAPDRLNAALDEYIAYYEGQGVRPTGPLQSNQQTIQGVPVVSMTVPATWKGKPTIVQFLQVAVVSDNTAGKMILVGYWASPEGDAKHNDAVSRLMAETVLRR